ncbi:hypothetical protein E1265_21980 [Streptomyces sp. 8K308]|nr:hypothetical protein E1265_21980 [Streptomyces sp. 8K308]
MVALDIEGSAGRGNEALLTIREVLARSVREALALSGVDWDACLRHDLGDGLRVTVPAGTWKARLIHPFVPELAARLRAHNRTAGELTRVRVRMALHAGDVRLGPDGEVAGGALETLARLLDAPRARAALAEAPPSVPVALLVSRHFHDETVRHGYPGIDPEDFRRVSVTAKEFTADAWLHLPGHRAASPPPEEPAAAGHAPAPAAEGAGTHYQMTNRASGHGVINATQHGTQHVYVGRTP